MSKAALLRRSTFATGVCGVRVLSKWIKMKNIGNGENGQIALNNPGTFRQILTACISTERKPRIEVLKNINPLRR